MLQLKHHMLQISNRPVESLTRPNSIHASTAGGSTPYLEPAAQWPLRIASVRYGYATADATAGSLTVNLYPLPEQRFIKQPYKLDRGLVESIQYLVKGKVVYKYAIVTIGENAPNMVEINNTSRIPDIPSFADLKIDCSGGALWPESIMTEDACEFKPGRFTAKIKVEDSKILSEILDQIK